MPGKKRRLFILSLIVSLGFHGILLMAYDAYAVLLEPFSISPKPRVELLRPYGLSQAASVKGTEKSAEDKSLVRGSKAQKAKADAQKPDTKSEVIQWEQDKAKELKKFKTDAERKLFLTYFELLSLSIRSHLKYPQEAIAKNEGGAAYLVFTLNSKGELKSTALRQATGNSVLDQAVMQAIREASPFPPFPSGLGKAELNFYLAIRFNKN